MQQQLNLNPSQTHSSCCCTWEAADTFQHRLTAAASASASHNKPTRRKLTAAASASGMRWGACTRVQTRASWGTTPAAGEGANDLVALLVTLLSLPAAFGCHMAIFACRRSSWAGVAAGRQAPHLCALHICDVAAARQVQPVGLVQLGACRESGPFDDSLGLDVAAVQGEEKKQLPGLPECRATECR